MADIYPTGKLRLERLLAVLGLALIWACNPGPPPAIRQSDATAPAVHRNDLPSAGTALFAVRAAPSATPVPSPGPRLDDPGVSLGVVAELGQGAPWAAVWSALGDQLRILSPAGMRVLEREGAVWTARGLFPEIGSDVTVVRIFWRTLQDSLVRLDGFGHFRPAEASLCSGVGSSVAWDFSSDPSLLAYSGESEWGGWQINLWDLSNTHLVGVYWANPHDLQLTPSASAVAALEQGTGVRLFATAPSDPAPHEPIGTLEDPNATAMAVSRRGDEVITISEYHVLRWDPATGSLLETWEGRFPLEPVLAALKDGEVMIFDR